MILHLVAKAEWEAKVADPSYTPNAFAQDGFIHCTQGEELLLQVANRFYKDKPGEFLVLSVDEHKLKAEVKWEAASPPPVTGATAAAAATAATVLPLAEAPPEARAEFGNVGGAIAPPPVPSTPKFPHIYGPLNRDAIVAIRRMLRAPDGTFTGFAPLPRAEPAGMNLKSPSQLANELLDATDGFSDALARYKDHVEAHMDELDKNIKDKLS